MATYDSFAAAWELFNAELRAAFSANHHENNDSAHARRLRHTWQQIETGDPPMDTINMPDDINHHRRHFFGTAALAIAAAQLALTDSANAQSAMTPQPDNRKPAVLAATKPGTNTSFGALKQIDAGLLNVGYAEAGPADGPAVLLLHGWPYDIHCYVDVVPLLALAGYRVIVPCLRGYGTTRFLSDATLRSGQPTAVAVDIVALMDALKI